MIRLEQDAGAPRLSFPRLSDEQRVALADTREVAVTAGAGAGKTTTLSARFVALHERLLRSRGGTDPAGVLVLTFSERAAEEMRERCYQMVSAVARASVTGPATLRVGWESLRDRFAGAAITTFHGFCARIVREFAPEADVSPSYTILEESEATALVLDAAAAAVDARLADPGPAIRLLLRTFGSRARLCEAVGSLVTGRAELLPRLRAHAEGRLDGAALASSCGVPLPEAERFVREELEPFARSLLAITGPIDTPFLSGLRGVVARLDAAGDDPLALGSIYAEGLACCATSKGEPRSLGHHSSTGTEALWGARKGAVRKGLLAPLQAALDGWARRIATAGQAPNRHDRTLAAVLEALATVSLDAIARHAEALRAREALDFTELQVRARAVLEAPGGEPLAALRARHRYVMVDEFQDTDGLQWAIVEALTRPDHGPRDRLFFVGDAKQAIYGFRGGDVEVFSQALASVAATEEGLGCSLTINRRSRPELIAFFNDLFRHALGDPAPGRPGWEAAYEPLAPGRTETGGTVRWVVSGQPVEGEDEEAPLDAVAAEAQAVARLIATEILPGRGPYAGDDLRDTSRFPSPPIALLLRRRTRLPVWEAALREAGVPFLVLGGMGFWSRPEVLDVVNLLVALTRGDPVAKVGALRSPLFGLDDDDLVAVHQLGRLRTFGDGPAPEALVARPAALASWDRWARLAAQARHASTAELIHAALSDSRQAWQQSWLHPDGRSLANLGRLLDLADAHDLQGHDLAAFAAFAATQVENDAREGEAPPPRSDARVVISTIHGSKGLEYPVVVLPELDARPRAGGAAPVLRVARGGAWELACPVPAGEGAVDSLAAPGLLATLQGSARAREHAEYLRLFYVACTRARDHLVLVGPRTDGTRSPPLWSDLLTTWAASAEPGPWWMVDEASSRPPSAPHADEAGVLPDAGPPGPAPLPPPDLLHRIAPLPTRLRVEVSPSSLALAADDPVLWRRRHLLRVEEIERPWAAGSEGASAYAAAVGKVVHALLEDDVLDDDGAIRARWLAAGREAALSEADLGAGLEAVQAQAAVLAASPVVRSLFHRATWRELPVLWQPEGSPVVLSGRMDLLCRDPDDGAWMVVDYKSHGQRGPEGEDTGRFRLQLLAYSVAASRVLEARGQPPVARGAVLFTRTGRLVRLPDWTAADRQELEERLAALGALVEAWAAEG